MRSKNHILLKNAKFTNRNEFETIKLVDIGNDKIIQKLND